MAHKSNKKCHMQVIQIANASNTNSTYNSSRLCQDCTWATCMTRETRSNLTNTTSHTSSPPSKLPLLSCLYEGFGNGGRSWFSAISNCRKLMYFVRYQVKQNVKCLNYKKMFVYVTWSVFTFHLVPLIVEKVLVSECVWCGNTRHDSALQHCHRLHPRHTTRSNIRPRALVSCHDHFNEEVLFI